MADNHASTPRFMLVGPIGAGKTTLFNALFGRDGEVRKTQAMEFETGGIDTPGEYFSHPRMYSALITTSADVDILVYVHPCGEREFRLPPGLFDVYAGKRLIGVITKTDLPECDADRAEELLRNNGVNGPIFRVSARDPGSVAPLRNYLLGNVTAAAATARSVSS